MAFETPTFKEIEDALHRDLANLSPELRLSGDSDWAIRAAAIASAIEGLYQHQRWAVRQAFPDTADTAQLERHCALRDITRKPAVASGGTVQASGTPGVPIPVGSVLQHEDGRRYLTTTTAAIAPSGSVALAVRAELPGVEGDLPAGQRLTFQSPPLGVQAEAISAALVGGLPLESDAGLLARLLERIRHPPAGGNWRDFRAWALAVPGITAAYVYPQRRGEGTVDVVVCSGDGAPSGAVLAAAQAYIDDVRPVTARGALVVAPTLQPVPVRLQLAVVSSYRRSDVEAAVRDAVTTYLLALEPGQPALIARLLAVAMQVPGVQDAQLIEPAANVTASVTAGSAPWLRPGAITLGAL